MGSSNGCNGGYANSCPNYALKNKIIPEAELPYKAIDYQNNNCTVGIPALANAAGKTRFQIKSYRWLTGCQLVTRFLFRVGPISICTTTDNNWFTYKSGTIIPSCSPKAGSGHCYLLVGASVKSRGTAAQNFWKFKNSWGTGWG